MFVDRDWRGIEGRWFTGGYDELGIDVKLTARRHATLTSSASTAPGCKQGGAGQTLKIYVANPPASVQAARPRLRRRRHRHAARAWPAT